MTHLRNYPWLGISIFIIIIINIAILFLAIPALSDRLHSSYNQDGYADCYDQLAANLVAGNGYRVYPETAKTMIREPGYPLLLAGLFLLFGQNITAVKVANLVLAFAAALLMTRIARRVSSSRVLLLGPSLLFLLHPGTLIAESRGGVEIAFAFLLVLFMLTVYRAIDSNSALDYMVSGAVLGLAILVKGTPILFPFFLFIYILIVDRRAPASTICRNVVLLVAVMFAVLSPWIIRNYLLTGRFVPTADVLGISAHAGLYDNTHVADNGNWAIIDREGARERTRLAQEQGFILKNNKNGYYQDFYSSNDELEFSRYLFREVMSEYQNRPLLFIECVRNNLFNFWFRGKNSAATTMNIILQLPFLFLAIVGVALSIRNTCFRLVAPLVLFIIYIVAVHAVVLAQARYSVPMIPFMSILGCIPLAAVQERVSRRERDVVSGVHAA